MTPVILSLGTNLGDRNKNMAEIITQLEPLFKTPLIISNLMETEPIGTPDIQQWYYNRIVLGQYISENAEELLAQCQNIEIKLGRIKKNTRDARTADIDILFFNNCIIQSENLSVPHPEVLNRRFCIEGITLIAPEWVHPVVKMSFRDIKNGMNKEVLNQKINFIDI